MEQNKVYKRQDRTVSPQTREKISASLRGRKKSYTHCQHISQGLKNMWQQIPPKQDTGGTVPMSDIVL